MSESQDKGGDVDEEVPDAVMEWLSSMAAERGVSETELLRSLLAGQGAPGSGGGGGDVTSEELHRVEREFQELVEDVRERIVQVKREADEKAPADHSHQELRSTLEQLGRQVGSLDSEVERLEGRLEAGFGNYEEILTYLTETTDSLDRKLGRLASAVIDLREQVGAATREEARRTALAHLTETANRNGVEKAVCDECGDGVHVGMLVQPRCPHCDASFTALEPKGGFFRKSVLHTGTMPALEPGPDGDDEEGETLKEMAQAGGRSGDGAPSFDMEGVEDPGQPGDEASDSVEAGAVAAGGADPATDGQRELEAIDGIGPAYADRLQEAGIDNLRALAVADPAQLSEAIDIPAGTVADWVEQAGGMAAS